EEAVALGKLDPEVLDAIRSRGESRAVVHLDVERILTLAGDLGPSVPERIGKMRTILAENKQSILKALGPSLEVVRDYEYIGAFVAVFRSERVLLALLQVPGIRNVSVEDLGEEETPIAAQAGFQPGPGSPTYQGEGVYVGVL